MSTPFPTTIAGKLEYASKIKDEGNELFKMQNYKKAIKVFAFTKGLPGSKRGLDSVSEMVNNSRGGSVAITEEEDATAIDLESVVNVNIAICYLKLDQPFKVIDHCNAAIALKPSNWKAYLRKGEALTLTGDYDKALNTLSHAKDLLNEIASLNTSDSSSNSSSSSSSSIGSSSSGSSSSSSNSTAAMGGQKAVLDALRVVKEKMKLETKKEKEKLSGFLNK